MYVFMMYAYVYVCHFMYVHMEYLSIYVFCTVDYLGQGNAKGIGTGELVE